jgi:hypothetical protein
VATGQELRGRQQARLHRHAEHGENMSAERLYKHRDADMTAKFARTRNMSVGGRASLKVCAESPI